MIPLIGHFFDMVGFRMPDNVVFLADCISSRETLDRVEQMEAVMLVPAHTDASTDVKELVRYNRDKVYEVAERTGFCPSVGSRCALSVFCRKFSRDMVFP